MLRREFLSLSAAAGAGALLGCGRSPLARDRGVNLILVISDALRADHLGSYGCPMDLSPSLDDLARQGTLFTQAMSSAPLTGASHATIMTGTYQTRHTVTDNLGRLPAEVMTLAQVCKSRRLETAAFVSNINLTAPYLAGIERGFDLYNSELPSGERNRPQQLYRDARDTAEAAVAWLRAHHTSPFFLWVHFMEPHGPYEVADHDQLELIHNLPTVPGEPEALPVLAANDQANGIPAYQVLGDRRDPWRYRRRYAARVRYMDSFVQRLRDEIRRSRLEESTYVFFMSDHGEFLGEHHFYFLHGVTVLQPVLHVPLIVAGPGIGRGRRITVPVSNADIMPTALDLLGFSLGGEHPAMQGRSLAPMLRGRTAPATPIFALARRDQEWVIRRGQLKYALSGTHGSGREGLFDLEADPGEEHDLSSARAAEAAELKKTLLAFMTTNPTVLEQPLPAAPRMSPEDIERFKSLGYL